MRSTDLNAVTEAVKAAPPLTIGGRAIVCPILPKRYSIYAVFLAAMLPESIGQSECKHPPTKDALWNRYLNPSSIPS